MQAAVAAAGQYDEAATKAAIDKYIADNPVSGLPILVLSWSSWLFCRRSSSLPHSPCNRAVHSLSAHTQLPFTTAGGGVQLERLPLQQPPLLFAAANPNCASSLSAGGGVQLERLPLLQARQGGPGCHGRQVHRP